MKTIAIPAGHCPVGWGCRIHRLLLCSRVRHEFVLTPPVVSCMPCSSNFDDLGAWRPMSPVVHSKRCSRSSALRKARSRRYPARTITNYNECPEYDTKKSVPVMLKLCEKQSTPSLALLPGPLWTGVIAPDRVLSISQVGQNCVLVQNWIFKD